MASILAKSKSFTSRSLTAFVSLRTLQFAKFPGSHREEKRRPGFLLFVTPSLGRRPHLLSAGRIRVKSCDFCPLSCLSPKCILWQRTDFMMTQQEPLVCQEKSGIPHDLLRGSQCHLTLGAVLAFTAVQQMMRDDLCVHHHGASTFLSERPQNQCSNAMGMDSVLGYLSLRLGIQFCGKTPRRLCSVSLRWCTKIPVVCFWTEG